VRLSHRLYKLKPIISTSEMMRHLECGRDFEVNQNCKKVPCSLANGPQRIRKEGTAGHRMLQCIGYTSVVQCEGTVVLRSVEMRIFRLWNAIRGNLRNVLHLIFHKLPLDNFPHSVFCKIPTPGVDVVRLHWGKIGQCMPPYQSFHSQTFEVR